MSAIPEGFTTITPSLTVKDAAKALELYKKAFGAKEISRMEDPKSGKIVHACIEIGTSKLFLSDEIPGMCKASTSSFYLYMPDCDAAFAQAEKAGLKGNTPVQDMFWGDRLGNVTDEFGINWTIATHKRDVSPAELQKGRDEMMARMCSNAA